MHGVVASSQPLACKAGTDVLQKGGNAADAAVAVAAALNVLQPTSTGIGGDCFCLFWDNKEKKVKGMNGSGRAPLALNLEYLNSIGITHEKPWDPLSALCVNVPGAAAGWVDCVQTFGSGVVSLSDVLSPAIQLAREGFPVGTVCASDWKNSERLLKAAPNGSEMLVNGDHAPEEGEVMKNPTLADTFEALATQGKPGFYEGRIASELVSVTQSAGGVISLQDLKNHKTTFVEPITVNYRGVDVYEIPPNGQGIAALMALNLVEGFDVASMEYQSPDHLHLLLECMRIAFSDTSQYVTDPEFFSVPTEGMLSKEYAAERRKLINNASSNKNITHGHPHNYSGTVYFCVVDKEGNACSFINSNYMGFGTGIVPKGCGFTLQNRGHNFSLVPGHPNVVEGGKRCYHTIIPGMLVKDGELLGPFGVMGGWMQPQGHFQVVMNLVDWKMSPQKALDAPRFLIDGGTHAGRVYLEDGISDEVIAELKKRGHLCRETTGLKGRERSTFGVGQIILRNPETGVLCAGSDPRHDGQALGY